MSTGLLLDCDEQVATWLFTSMGMPAYKYDRAIGLVDKAGKLIGGVLFQSWNGANVELSYFGKKTITLGIVRCLAQYILLNFDLARLTVVTSKRNRQFMKGLQKIGFKIEGMQRCFYGKRDCNRNVGVRFVAFRETIEKVAKFPAEVTQQCS